MFMCFLSAKYAQVMFSSISLFTFSVIHRTCICPGHGQVSFRFVQTLLFYICYCNQTTVAVTNLAEPNLSEPMKERNLNRFYFL